MSKTFTFKSKVWLYPGKAAWHFVTLPQDIADDIDFRFEHIKRGWGSLRVKVTVGKTSWLTSIFPDKKSKSYVLPVKAEVRKKENIKEGREVSFLLEVVT